MESVKFRIKKGYVQRCIGGEYLLIPTGAENIQNYNGIITINKTTAFLCDLLKEGCTLEELAEELAGHFEVEKGQAVADVEELLQTMKQHHMLEEI